MHVGIMNEITQTPGAIKITVQGKELNGRSDRTVYLPKSQVEIKRTKTGQFRIWIPDWLINKNQINWYRIAEIEPELPGR